MRIPHTPTAPAALLAAAVVLAALWSMQQQDTRRDTVVAAPSASDGIAQARFAHCRENVTLIHDVAWAAACQVQADEARRTAASCATRSGACPAAEEPDDSPECTLGPARAATLNQARSAAEAQCLADARGLTALR